jgi:hypothetical protein
LATANPTTKKDLGNNPGLKLYTTELRKPLEIKIQKHLVELVQDRKNKKNKKNISHNNTAVAIRSSSHSNHNPNLLNPFYSNKENKFRSDSPK